MPDPWTTHLASIVRRAIPSRGWQRIDPATRTFQALRIWVNRELDGLATFLRDAVARLAAGARIAIIAFHSLEDRIVKHTFRQHARDPDQRLGIVTKRPIEASEDEVARNPRARSAKLRVAERLA
jgi:16S rRNA (cytosine1402-N4)-methyltransferase